jgi:hypothetical protein
VEQRLVALFDLWLRDGLHEELMVGPGLTRHLSALAQMELRSGCELFPFDLEIQGDRI